jgi:hypothetical protein
LRRCCQNEEGRQYGSHCPKLKSYPQRGTWGYHLSHGSDPKTANGASPAKPDSPPNRQAASALAELKTRLDKGTYTEPSRNTLAEYAPEALARRRTTGFARGTVTVDGPWRRSG